jgi:hypothetical protein
MIERYLWLTKGGPPAWKLGKELKLTVKKAYYETSQGLGIGKLLWTR